MANVAYEQALEIVRSLSPEEQQRLLREIESEHRQQKPQVNGGAEIAHQHEREMRWLREHRKEYSGQWVALDGDRLVSHNEALGKVFDEANAQGVKAPFTAFIKDPDQPSMRGWSDGRDADLRQDITL